MDWYSDELKTELRKILEEDYNVNLSDNEIERFGVNIVKVFDLLYETQKQQVQKFEHRPTGFIDESGKKNIKLKQRVRL